MATMKIENDEDCSVCGAVAKLLRCDGCGVEALITNCGHMAQPRPIAAGRADGSEMGNVYCQDCADAGVVTYWVNTADSDTPSAWMSIASAVRPGAQDSGRCAFHVEVAAGRVADLEAALDADDGVIEYRAE